MSFSPVTLLFTLFLTLVDSSFAQASEPDNRLSLREEQEGWILLFDGETYQGWTTSDEKPSARPIEDGAINPHKCGGYMMIHQRKWSDLRKRSQYKGDYIFRPDLYEGYHIPKAEYND